MSVEARISKTEVPMSSFSDQAGVGVYFEFTHFTCQIDPFTGAEVLVDNLALFAIAGQLYRKLNSGTVTASPTSPAAVAPVGAPDGWARVESVDAASAYLSVMRAWEFATHRPAKSHAMFNAASGGDPVPVTVAAHWLASEPLFWPVTETELEKARKGERVDAIAEAAENFWLQLATAATYDDGTPGHRVPTGQVPLDTSMLLGKIMSELITETPTSHPLFADQVSPPMVGLPESLRIPIAV